MRTIYVVTHPEATHHVEGVVGGWHDSELTPAGARAAAGIAESLRPKVPEGTEVELYSSDLRRTAQTARAIGDLFRAEPVLDRRLREKSHGDAEGRPQAWLDERFIPPPLDGERLRHDEGIPGAETKVVFAKRVYAAMDAILSSSAEHQVVVTHGYAAASRCFGRMTTFVTGRWSASGDREAPVLAQLVASSRPTLPA